MQIIMRHGNDNQPSKYKHDNSLKLNDQTKEEIINHTKKLIKKYGHPDVIYCSPFRRGIETVKIMKKVFHKPVNIYIDAKLSRYFNNNEKQFPSVSEKTLKYKPPIHETHEAFYKRVDKVHYKMDSRSVRGSHVWYITHYLVMKRIANNDNIQLPSYMPFLYTMLI